MDLRLAARLEKINPSPTLALTTKAKKLKAEGRDVVNFAAGEPDFDTPDFIKEAAIEAIRSGFTKYTASTGTAELKQAISEKFKRDNALAYSPQQIVVSCGAKHSIFNCLLALIDRGDEVLIPSPYWVSYPEMVNLCEGVPRFIETSPENNFKASASLIEKEMTPKTRLLILNSPANPTGAVYSAKELQDIAALCAERKIFVLSDEIYEQLIYDGLTHVSIASLRKDIYDLTITVNGLSKSHSMTGWRIGYLGASAGIVEAVSKLQDHSTSNPSSISQKAALAALKDASGFSSVMRQEFQKRRDYIVERLGRIKGMRLVVPGGAFYIFCDISKTKLDAATVASRILEEASVAIIPGEGFGRKDHVRLSFATSLPQIVKGLDRIEEWFKQAV